MTGKRLGRFKSFAVQGLYCLPKQSLSRQGIAFAMPKVLQNQTPPLGLDIDNRLGKERGSMAVPAASKCFIHRTRFFPDEILEPANQIDGGGILIVASYPNSMCKPLHPRVFSAAVLLSCRFAQECRCRSRH
jgi:hypothetical protein